MCLSSAFPSVSHVVSALSKSLNHTEEQAAPQRARGQQVDGFANLNLNELEIPPISRSFQSLRLTRTCPFNRSLLGTA